MILAYLLLITGLTISAVAIYYSVVGLTAIFSAAVVPIIIMGSALEVGKLVCASWLKANWERAPRFMKYYMITAVLVLMLITSMGIFGFLSKAHNDQNLVSGDVQSKIAIYDEKIKTARENIEADRRQLKQMDEAVDQVMARSSDEKGADKSNSIRKSQLRDRLALAKDIETNQKLIASLNDEAAPIRAEVRKVEAEVGPIKYIAKFIYGEKGAEEDTLEKAVTWVIILIVIVFDPLAVIMLLGAQMTFGWMKEEEEDKFLLHKTVEHTETKPDAWIADVGEKPTEEEKAELEQEYAELMTTEEVEEFTEHSSNQVLKEIPPYQIVDEEHEPDYVEIQENVTWPFPEAKSPEVFLDSNISELDKWETAAVNLQNEIDGKKIKEAEKYIPEVERPGDYLALTDRLKPDLTEVIEPEGSKKKTYMMKDPTGHLMIQTKE